MADYRAINIPGEGQTRKTPSYFQRAVNTVTVDIFICGAYQDINRLCQAFCNDVGLCVTVTPTDFVFKDGHELGCKIGMINYGRFPKTSFNIEDTALDLALYLLDNLEGQESFSIVSSSGWTLWHSERECDIG